MPRKVSTTRSYAINPAPSQEPKVTIVDSPTAVTADPSKRKLNRRKLQGSSTQIQKELKEEMRALKEALQANALIPQTPSEPKENEPQIKEIVTHNKTHEKHTEVVQTKWKTSLLWFVLGNLSGLLYYLFSLL